MFVGRLFGLVSRVEPRVLGMTGECSATQLCLRLLILNLFLKIGSLSLPVFGSFACMSVCVPCACLVPTEDRREFRCPGTWVRMVVSCHVLGIREAHLGLLDEQPVLDEPFLQPPIPQSLFTPMASHSTHTSALTASWRSVDLTVKNSGCGKQNSWISAPVHQ